jgi:hypothetical protein
MHSPDFPYAMLLHQTLTRFPSVVEFRPWSNRHDGTRLASQGSETTQPSRQAHFPQRTRQPSRDNQTGKRNWQTKKRYALREHPLDHAFEAASVS